MEIDLGFCWFFPESCAPEEGLQRLKECGFDGIELWPQFIERFGSKRWARALGDAGMKCLQLCPYFNFVSGPEKIAESRGIFAQFRELSEELDCSRIRVFTGPPWGDGVVGAKSATAEQWSAAIEELGQFCAAAPELEFCLECHEGSLMEDAPSALRLIQAISRPNLKANLQLPLLGEDWQKSVDLLGEHTTHIHIHNWTKGLGIGDLTFLGQGAFDWLAVLKLILAKNQGRVCLSVEHPDHGGAHEPWETAQKDGATLREWGEELFAPRKGHGCIENVFCPEIVLTEKSRS